MEFSNQYIFFLISLQFKAGGQKAILAFSLPRNWYRLISIPQTEESRVLRYIQGFRYITIFFVIWGHTLVGITLGFNLNPYKVEESFHQILPHLNLNALKMFVKMYVPVHVNMGNYFFGIATGLYCHYARTVKMPGPKMRKFILIGAYLMPILCAFVITLHYFFYANDFEKPSIWMALMSILTKNLWSYFCVFCTCAMVLKIEKFFINFLQMKIFQPLGRITYCIFLCHFDLMRILAAEARENMTVSSFMVMASVTTVFFFANFLALILCLCLEFPSTALLKMWIKKETAIQKEDENKNIELTQDMNSNTIKNPI
uniref:CSON015542 protein n=1 Tax=Culicoides sonorensis TaxID=179676 RepID=A0A336KWQ4_CULSO